MVGLKGFVLHFTVPEFGAAFDKDFVDNIGKITRLFGTGIIIPFD